MRQAFGIFEGGGAKGISHIGALKAAEEEEVVFIGVAGTSAGAIVAALISVGYQADDIFSTVAADANLLSRHDYSVLGLLGESDWKSFNLAKPKIKRLLSSLYVGGVVAGRAFASSALTGAWRVTNDLGYFGTKKIREAVNRWLRKKMGDHFAKNGKNPKTLPDWIRFEDIDPTNIPQCCRLKIIVTDALTQQLVIFDHSTPRVVVADAVCASISIPFAFKPGDIRESSAEDKNTLVSICNKKPRFVDGGLVSNLPAWVFVDEKTVRERNVSGPIPIFAFKLRRIGAEEGGHWMTKNAGLDRCWNYISNVANTAIFGSQDIVQEFVEDLHVIKVDTQLDTLDFDCTWPQAVKAHDDGYASALYELKYRFNLIEEAGAKLVKLADAIRSKINAIRNSTTLPQIDRLRTCIIEPFGRSSYRVTYSANMENDADDRMILDVRNPGAPKVFQKKQGEPVFLAMDGKEDLYMSKYERALVWPNLKSLIALPIFKNEDSWEGPTASRKEPIAAFCVDCNENIYSEFSEPSFLSWLIKETAVLSTVINRS